MENENIPAVILSIIAILISAVAIGVICFNQPDKVDLSGIGDNEVIITAIQGDVEILQDDIDDIDCVITEDDLEDLEDDLEKYCRNRCEDGDDGEDGVDGEDWFDMSLEEYSCLVDSLEAAGSGYPIVGNYTMFEDCLGNITITS